jgi:hypothetical protein
LEKLAQYPFCYSRRVGVVSAAGGESIELVDEHNCWAGFACSALRRMSRQRYVKSKNMQIVFGLHFQAGDWAAFMSTYLAKTAAKALSVSPTYLLYSSGPFTAM